MLFFLFKNLSMSIRELEPKRLWNHFADICKIPHPSGHEAALANFLAGYAKSAGMDAFIDKAGNVIIKKKAARGRENAPMVILQAHLDMVPVKTQDSLHNFLTDPIIPKVDSDGFVTARGTTLGADDGIGIATALAILDDEDLPHGPITAIFTTAEETTMEGACLLDPKYLEGALYLINLDSVENGVLFVGCAGSLDVALEYTADLIPKPDSFEVLKLNLYDLKGGHSGSDIHLGRANAIALMAELLQSTGEKFLLGNFTGGAVRNAIASSCEAKIAVPGDKLLKLKDELVTCFDTLKEKFAKTDPDMKLKITRGDSCDGTDEEFAQDQSTKEMLNLVGSLRLGVLSWSDIDPGVVQTSCNLGIARFDKGIFRLNLLPRSLKKQDLHEAAHLQTDNAFCQSLGTKLKTQISGEHSPWLSPSKNCLIDTYQKMWQEVTGGNLKVTVIHAGLECAFLSQKGPSSLQLISIGATIKELHSPGERVHIKGVAHTYEALRRTLAKL